MDPLQGVERAVGLLETRVPPALWPWLIVGLGTAVAIALHGLVWSAVAGILHNRTGLAVSVVRRLRRPARLFLLVLVFSVLVQVAGLPPVWRAGLAHGSLAILIVIAGWIVIVGIDTASERFAASLRFDTEDNLSARAQATQVRVLQRVARILVGILTAALVLSTFENVRQFGVSLFASAGAAGLVLGFAARPVLANLIAGIQIAVTQPIRVEDVVIVEGEWGWVEEIASTYVVIRIWDLRRLVVPLSYFIEKPFQNWTRDSGSIIGNVVWHLDYTAPIAQMRDKIAELVSASPHWDGRVVNLQVVEADRDTLQVRGLMSARNASLAWDLRCEIRERMLDWLQEHHPGALPRTRAELRLDSGAEPASRRGDGERG